MKIAGHPIGLCSWSLRSGGLNDLTVLLRQFDLQHVHLAIAPLLDLDRQSQAIELGHLRQAGLVFTAGMVDFPGEDYSSIGKIHLSGGLVPDDLWPRRKEMTLAAASICRQLDIGMLTTHIGYIPPSNHENYPKMIQRVGELAESLGQEGIELAAETGPDPAAELLQFLNDLPQRSVGVNFDPANFILYGVGEPVEAVRTLGRHIRHVHIKDARSSRKPRLEWGQEVPPGQGQVDFAGMLSALQEAGYDGPLVIEREAGDTLAADIAATLKTLENAAG